MTLSKAVGDLQLGDKKVTLNHLEFMIFWQTIISNPRLFGRDEI